MFAGLWRDLMHAGRSLAKARAFTCVCVVSLGIGMAPVIAIPYVSRLTTLTPPGVNAEELVELVTTSVGPHQQTERWSYPDYVDLRDANTGITLIGWAGAQSDITFQATGGSLDGRIAGRDRRATHRDERPVARSHARDGPQRSRIHVGPLIRRAVEARRPGDRSSGLPDPGEPARKLTMALEQIALGLDPEFQPAAIVTGVGLREFSMNDFLTQSAVAAVAGGVILLLAALGIYGVIGLMVATRTREIAVRAALGATRRRLLAMIIRDVVKLVLPGTVVGVLLTVGLNRLNAENMGISLSNAEPIAYVVGPAIAVLVAVLASLAPARRAASVPPMVAMRSL